MAYPYQRKNYGDYYAGDLFGSIFKGIGGAIGGFIKGGPTGAVSGGVKGLFDRGKKDVPAPPEPQGVPRGYPGATPGTGLIAGAQRFLPGGASGYVAASCPVGYHYNKALARYERAVAMGKQVKQPHVINACVAHRKMNPLNPRALRRAVRRTNSAVVLMRRAMKGTGYTISRRGLGKTSKRRR